MSTTEIIVVFSALMALIALVTIGIDWIGKPLKHRRFIPRMYRFDDEKLPVDAYGHPQLDAPLPEAIAPAAAWTPPAVYHQPPPVVVATVPEPLTAASAPPAPTLDPAPLTAASAPPAPTLDPSSAALRDAKSALGPDEDPTQPASTSAFSDRLIDGSSGEVPVTENGAWAASGLVPDYAAMTLDASSTSVWSPGMALDAVVNDERPSLATKAERYWKATAAALEESHFDAASRDRMTAGKAPRRRNPRSGRMESMQLTGLRRGSTRSDIRMAWPDSSVDPWATT